MFSVITYIQSMLRSPFFYARKGDAHSAIVGKISVDALRRIGVKDGTYKLPVNLHTAYVSLDTFDSLIPQCVVPSYDCIHQTLPKIADVVSPLDDADKTQLEDFFHGYRQHVIELCQGDRVGFVNIGYTVHVYDHHVVGHYRGEDSGALYPEYEHTLIAKFDLSNSLFIETDQETYKELLLLRNDCADWKPLCRHRKLFDYLMSHPETLTIQKGLLYYPDSLLKSDALLIV